MDLPPYLGPVDAEGNHWAIGTTEWVEPIKLTRYASGRTADDLNTAIETFEADGWRVDGELLLHTLHAGTSASNQWSNTMFMVKMTKPDLSGSVNEPE